MFVNILIFLLGLLAIILLMAIFIRKQYKTQSEIVIQRPKNEVFEYIKLLKNQDFYNKWVMTDPQMEKMFKGNDGTVGFIYAWNGNNRAGEGEQEITEIEDGMQIKMEIRFVRPFASIAHASLRTESIDNDHTLVRWTNESAMKYPMNLLISWIEKMLAKDMFQSLSNLKNILEQKNVQSQ